MATWRRWAPLPSRVLSSRRRPQPLAAPSRVHRPTCACAARRPPCLPASHAAAPAFSSRGARGFWTSCARPRRPAALGARGTPHAAFPAVSMARTRSAFSARMPRRSYSRCRACVYTWNSPLPAPAVLLFTFGTMSGGGRTDFSCVGSGSFTGLSGFCMSRSSAEACMPNGVYLARFAPPGGASGAMASERHGLHIHTVFGRRSHGRCWGAHAAVRTRYPGAERQVCEACARNAKHAQCGWRCARARAQVRGGEARRAPPGVRALPLAVLPCAAGRRMYVRHSLTQ